MGEIQRYVHKLAEDQFETLLEVIRTGFGTLATPPAGDATPARTPYDLGLEPWTFHDPSQKVDVMAYIDDRNLRGPEGVAPCMDRAEGVTTGHDQRQRPAG